MQTLMEHLPSELTCVLRLSAATLIVFSSSDGNPSSKGKILLCAVEFHDTPQRPKMFFLTGISSKHMNQRNEESLVITAFWLFHKRAAPFIFPPMSGSQSCVFTMKHKNIMH